MEKLGSRPRSEKKPRERAAGDSWGLWTNHSAFLGLSFLLCKKDGEHPDLVLNLKFHDELKDSSLEPRGPWLAASTLGL